MFRTIFKNTLNRSSLNFGKREWRLLTGSKFSLVNCTSQRISSKSSSPKRNFSAYKSKKELPKSDTTKSNFIPKPPSDEPEFIENAYKTPSLMLLTLTGREFTTGFLMRIFQIFASKQYSKHQ